jgi:hypothetical protein
MNAIDANVRFHDSPLSVPGKSKWSNLSENGVGTPLK